MEHPPTKPLLEQFRGSTKRLVIHPLERWALGIVGTHLALLPWALGGMRLWAQIPSLCLALAGFVLALIPRNYTEEHTGSNRFRLIMWPKLARFPLFWLGLALLAYIALQALNPLWVYEQDSKNWWMRKVANIAWLPSGVQGPIDRWGPWRMLLIYASTWLVVCTVWVAFTRRRTVQFLFLVIAGNGTALAAFGLAQRVLSNGKMFWLWTVPRDAVIFASFIYKNHAGAYLDLALAVMCGVAGWYYLRGLRRLEKSNPSGLFAFFATCTSVAVAVSYARGATVIMLAFLTVIVVAFVVHQLVIPNPHRKPVVAIVLMLLFGFFLKTGLQALQSHLAWDRIEKAITQQDTSGESRRIARQATSEMLHDYWPKGAGSGSFRFLFPVYQAHYPEIDYYHGARLYWEHAHDDVLELTAELGLVGVLLFVAALGSLALPLVRNFFWQNPLSACVVFGLGLCAVYSWWDFPFQCPAILMLWWVLAVAATMWTEMEELNLKG